MRTIIFRETQYELASRENVMPLHFQATIVKENYSVESIAEDARNAEEIKIYEDEEQVAIYKGYTDLLTVSMYEALGKTVVSVELLNHNYEQQLNDLSASMIKVEAKQAKQEEAIAELTPYAETKTAYYNEKEKTFYNVPEGNVSVFFDNYNGQYSVSRVSDRVIVSFDTLAQATNITISVN